MTHVEECCKKAKHSLQKKVAFLEQVSSDYEFLIISVRLPLRSSSIFLPHFYVLAPVLQYTVLLFLVLPLLPLHSLSCPLSTRIISCLPVYPPAVSILIIQDFIIINIFILYALTFLYPSYRSQCFNPPQFYLLLPFSSHFPVYSALNILYCF